MRGKLASRPINAVLREAERLVEAGVKEILVISQDTSAYGVDIRHAKSDWRGDEYEARMLDLCKGLGDLGVWVRLHYVYPYPSVDHVIPLMAEGKILPYLDIPFQHASPKVLRAMRRPADHEKVLERIKSWRSVCPRVDPSADIYRGFPGPRDEDDCQLLLDWLFRKQTQSRWLFQIRGTSTGSGSQTITRSRRLKEMETRSLGKLMSHQQSISRSTYWLKR
ncbi:UNVERIFIED_CONTAM: hypothetical protein GTU68_028791 [Idotea baltica]|nr:hypothetical protein [Idotea baltica]